MFTSETLSNALHAIATGFLDRALNLVVMSEELDDAERDVLRPALEDLALSPAQRVRRWGDAIRECGSDRSLSNECYRLAFYLTDGPVDLTDNELYRYFLAQRSGRLLDKWVHYFEIYDRHLSSYRGKAPSVLEIGVYQGGSLDMWRRYMGPGAKFVGVDIDPAAIRLADPSATVVLGDQADPDFLRSVHERYGPFDIVIDDGGHTMEQQITTVEVLFPLLEEGGTFVVEDCHTSYWEEFSGGRGRPGTFIEWTKRRVDDLHRYHEAEPVDPTWTDQVNGIHCYDSVVVLDKRARHAPFNEQVGASTFVFLERPASVLVGEMLATRDAALTELGALLGAGEELRLTRSEIARLAPRSRELEAEVARLEGEVTVLRNDLLEAWEQARTMRRTLSWRATAPLRAARRRQRGSR